MVPSYEGLLGNFFLFSQGRSKVFIYSFFFLDPTCEIAIILLLLVIEQIIKKK